MEMMRVTTKQMHQKDMDQLPVAPLQMPMSATREKATQEEKSCGGRRQRQQHVTSKKPLSQVSPQCTWAVLVWLVVDRVSLLEQAQGPVMAEAQDLWSWNQWLRQLGNSTAAPEWFPPPITPGLVRRLVLSQASQLGVV